MSTELKMAKQAVHDKIGSQVKTEQAKLQTLKAQAEATKANVEIKVIASLLTRKHAIDQKLAELKKSGGDGYEQAKGDVEARVAELEKSVKAIEAKVHAS